jgi:hypothetical protein
MNPPEPLKRYAILLEIYISPQEDPPYSWDWDALCGGTLKWTSPLEDDEEAEDFLATDHELNERDRMAPYTTGDPYTELR